VFQLRVNTLPKTLRLSKIVIKVNFVKLCCKFAVLADDQTAQYRQRPVPAIAIVTRPDKNPWQLRSGIVEDGGRQISAKN
jgi:hypothetical protein